MTKDELRKSLDFVNEERERLQKWVDYYKDHVIEQNKRINKAINKIQYIRDIGFDYDGFNDVEDLKKLIDELVRISEQSIDILRGKG